MNRQIKHPISMLLLTILLPIGLSCKKEYLSIKPDKALVIPSTLKDLQAIANNTAVMSGDNRSGLTPLLGELSDDNMHYTDNTWANLNLIEKNSYVWAKDPFAPATVLADWNKPYQAVFYANVILQGLENPSIAGNAAEKDDLKGTALFYRAHAFFHLLQIFAPPYNSADAATDLGIPLPINTNVLALNKRKTLAESYQQVIKDLEMAIKLLTETPVYKTRPCKAAGQGLLSRIYLIMGDYDRAFRCADAYLKLKNQLLDFNALNLTDARPIPNLNNPELVYFSSMISYLSTLSTALVSPELYALYPDNDLRRDAFFKRQLSQDILYKLGNYTSGSYYFSGIATDEILLIRAECYARKDNKNEAMYDLNKLRANRIDAEGYKDLQAETASQALDLILKERRLELCFRGLRWSDLRRLNKEPNFAVTLTRTIHGNTYTLPPKDPKYTFPIPATETDFNPMQQNVR